jgi:uncharacterized membrane protein YeaQ/YmgE (transglycosylase-associated protein family)
VIDENLYLCKAPLIEYYLLQEFLMAYLFSYGSVLAAGITIQLGNHAWSFGLNVIVYLIVAAIVGLVAEAIVGWRLPFGFIGAILAAIIGIWLMTQVIIINGIGDINIEGVPLLRALIGAVLLVALWHALTYRSWRGRERRRYSSRRRYRRY